MLKIIFSFLISLSMHSPNVGVVKNSGLKIVSKTVYICNSQTAKKYHFSKTCRGQGACKKEIKSVSLTEAKNKYKRTLCGWED